MIIPFAPGPPPAPPHPAGRRRAFTLIELLVAAELTALLVALMLGMAANVLKAWNRSSGMLQAGGQARLVFDQLDQDLRGAILRTDGGVWLAATVQPDQTGSGDAGLANASWTGGAGGHMKPGNSAPGDANSSLNLAPATGRTDDCRFGMAGVWLRFFTVQPDTNSGSLPNASAPRAVAYQIVRLRSSTQSTAYHYQLFRSQVRPGGASNSTFTLGFDLFMSATANPSYNRADGVDQNAGNLRRPNASQVMASNVIDFGIRFFKRDATGNLVLLFPSDAATGAPSNTNLGFAATTNPSALPPAPGGYAGHMTCAFPEVAEVFLRVLTSEGTRQLALFENPPAGCTAPAGKTWWDLATANSRVFTRRIEIADRPL